MIFVNVSLCRNVKLKTEKIVLKMKYIEIGTMWDTFYKRIKIGLCYTKNMELNYFIIYA